MRKTFRELQGLSEDTAKRRDVADAAQRKTLLPETVAGIEGAIAAAGIAPDDGIPPLAPTGLTVDPFSRTLAVSWDAPPVEDGVAKTTVRIRKVSDLSIVRSIETADVAAVVGDLPVIALRVDAFHTDLYGLSSGYSTSVDATPDKSVADLITEETAVAAGQFSNLLNDPGLAALTDPAKLADGVVRSAAQASTKDANILKYNEAEYENYATGTLVGAAFFTNNSGSIVSSSGKKWLSHTRSVGATDGWGLPFPSFIDRTEGATGDYLFSAEAKNTGASPIDVSVSVQKASDASGTGAAVIDGATVTVPAGASIRPFVRFTRDAAKPFIRFLYYIRSASGSILWNRSMLQKASATQTEPGAYIMPTLAAGILTAQLLAAWDVVAGQAIIADATIATAKIANLAVSTAKIDDLAVTSAKVASLAANKITTGSLTSAIVTLTSTGYLKAGGTVLDAGGLSLQLGDDYNISSYSSDFKVSGGGDFAALMFYWSTADNYRGSVLRSDGAGTGARGAVNIHSSVSGNVLADSSARIEVLANGTAVDGGRGRVNVYGNMVLDHLFNANDCVATTNSRSLAFHVHSYPFKELPMAERREILDTELRLRQRPTKGAVTREEIEDLKALIYASLRMHCDDPDMDRHDRERFLDTGDPEEVKAYKIKNNMDDHMQLRKAKEAEREAKRETRPGRIPALEPMMGVK